MRTVTFGKPIIGDEERSAVDLVMRGTVLVHGDKAKDFEASFASYTGAKHAVSVSSCTAALHLSYFYLGLGANDEVIVPAQTHNATAHAVELCGAKPVFVDAEKKTGNIDLDQIEQAITSKTRAISIVHYLGMPVNMDRIVQIAKKHKLFIVEDCALAMGTRFKGVHAGLHGDVGCFSFYPVKHITTAEGGMLITKHADVAAKITRQKAFGVDRHVGERSVPGVYDVTMLGFNYRMSEIHAAIGIEQMKRLEGFLKKRKENYEVLGRGLDEISEIQRFESTGGDYESSYYCMSILLNDRLTPKRFDLVALLKEAGIGTSVYYPRPVPKFSYYKTKYGCDDQSFPIASWISNSSIALPVGPHLSVEDMNYVADTIKTAINKLTGN
jgi:perosamine synthetase